MEWYIYLQNPFYCETCYYTSTNHGFVLVHLKGGFGGLRTVGYPILCLGLLGLYTAHK